MKKILTFLFSLIVGITFAQNNHPAKGLRKPLGEVDRMIMPTVNNDALMAAEMALPRKGRATSFAQPFDVQIKPDTHGTWEILEDGRAVWRLRVKSENALSLNFGFTQYRMPQGGKLFIYSLDRRTVMGPFTPSDNEQHNQLWTPIIEEEECVLEISLPKSEQQNLQIEIGKINHAFLDVAMLLSGSCNLDVICAATDGFPEVDNNRDIIRSVAMYSLEGSRTCSGALINNAKEDCTPYYLTADHCGVSQNNAPSIVVYWNYENSECRQPNTAPSGQGGDGVLTTFNTGSVRRATYDDSDFTLVELDDAVEPTANAYFAGWSREDIAPTSAIGIHHPNLEEKRISFENDACAVSSYLGSGGETHIQVNDWDIGTTEGGSSGSPLFDQNKRLVGQLTGGGAACGNDEPDWYGRMTVNWEGGGTAESRIKDWLDPDDTGLMFVNGRDVVACGFTVIPSPYSQEVCASTDAVYNLSVGGNFTAPVTMNVTDLPAGATATFSENPAAPGASVTLTITTNGVSSNTSILTINSTDGTENSSSSFQLIIFESIPNITSLATPADGMTDVEVFPQFEWSGDIDGTAYIIEIATDANFANIIMTESVEDITTYSGILLESMTTYYWRVKSSNICGETDWSNVYSFTTASIVCQNEENTTVVTIGNEIPNTVTSTITFPTAGVVSNINILDVIGEHSYISDLIFTITSPAGTTVTLVDRACNDESDFNISFNDNAATGTLPCPYNDGGTYQPEGNLTDFQGEEAAGTWTLTIEDDAQQDGGFLSQWTLQICLIEEMDVSTFDEQNLSFELYPNPSNGECSIILPTSPSTDTKATIIGMDGKIHEYFKLKKAQTTMDLSKIGKGIYLIQIKNNEGSRTEKLVIE